jgi:hypothetical protein
VNDKSMRNSFSGYPLQPPLRFGFHYYPAALHQNIFLQLLLCNRPAIFYELNNPQLVTFKPAPLPYTVFVLNFCFLTKINSVTIINAILSTVDKIVLAKKYQKLPNCQASNKNSHALCNKHSTLIKMA